MAFTSTGVTKSLLNYDTKLDGEQALLTKLLASPEEKQYLPRGETRDRWRQELRRLLHHLRLVSFNSRRKSFRHRRKFHRVMDVEEDTVMDDMTFMNEGAEEYEPDPFNHGSHSG